MCFGTLPSKQSPSVEEDFEPQFLAASDLVSRPPLSDGLREWGRLSTGWNLPTISGHRLDMRGQIRRSVEADIEIA